MRVAAFVLLTACASNVPGDSDSGLDVEQQADPGWTSVGYGVEYQQVNAGSAVLIAYGGYSAELSYSAAWSNELVDALLGGSGFGRIYAVQGPEDPSYAAKEIGNSKLRAHFETIDDGVSPIIVVAHSSGTYVAHELLDQLYAAGQTDVLARISYANLDGGGTGLTDDIIADLGAITFAYAHDPTLAEGYSENNASAKALGDDYAPKATTFEVTVPNTGCDSGYGWCLHDVLVTHRPHDPTFYDLADDYTDFVDRPVTTEYLPQFLSQK
ncbi:MAG TPA: hypothetical protein VGG28_24920 [Kofleriaceae bacterium]